MCHVGCNGEERPLSPPKAATKKLNRARSKSNASRKTSCPNPRAPPKDTRRLDYRRSLTAAFPGSTCLMPVKDSTCLLACPRHILGRRALVPLPENLQQARSVALPNDFQNITSKVRVGSGDVVAQNAKSRIMFNVGLRQVEGLGIAVRNFQAGQSARPLPSLPPAAPSPTPSQPLVQSLVPSPALLNLRRAKRQSSPYASRRVSP